MPELLLRSSDYESRSNLAAEPRLQLGDPFQVLLFLDSELLSQVLDPGVRSLAFTIRLLLLALQLRVVFLAK